jgi:dihydroorotase
LQNDNKIVILPKLSRKMNYSTKNCLIQHATVIDPTSPFHRQVVDILIEKGKISQIGSSLKINSTNHETWDVKGAFLSPGWLDIGTQIGEPGFEEREDLYSASQAAAYGGFTGIATYPNTHPVIHSKSEVAYIKHKTTDFLTDFFPIGALSHDCKGIDIAEMYDMYHAGAVAFSDGNKPVQHNGVMLRALQYVKTFDGVILNRPHDSSVAGNGQMHEGKISTSLGLSGIPSLSEEIMIVRDIALCEYADSRLHITDISTASGIELIRAAKQKGLRITTSVAVMNLAFDDTKLVDFNTNLKVLPPIRTENDRIALINAVLDGTIDCITTNHSPYNDELKDLEFPYSKFGAIGLETAFSLWNTTCNSIATPEIWVEKVAINPRKLLKINLIAIKKGAIANFTIFDTESEWVVSNKDIHSKSKNTSLIGSKLKGRVFGVVNNGKVMKCAD